MLKVWIGIEFQKRKVNTFENAEDFEKAGETDRVSIRALADLAPGSRVAVVFHHSDGSEEIIPTLHTMNADQIAWFQAGSALNLLRSRSAGPTGSESS